MSPFSRTVVHDVVLKALEQQLRVSGIPADRIDDDFNLFGPGALDSLSFVELIATIERMLGQRLDWGELDFDKLETLGGLIDELHRLQAHSRETQGS